MRISTATPIERAFEFIIKVINDFLKYIKKDRLNVLNDYTR